MTGPDGFRQLPDLASRALGGAVIDANDELYGDRAALIEPGPAQPRTEFGYRGKIYDVQSTALENYPGPVELAAAQWATLVPRSPAQGDTANGYQVNDPHRWTHLKLVIHPDGGVARFRVHGQPVADVRLLAGTVDLAAQEFGGAVLECSDIFFSSPANLLRPGPARSMGEGWETARRREGGNDWVVIQLAAAARLREIVVDTSHFVGNAPAQVQVSGAVTTTVPDGRRWVPLVPRRPVQPDTPHPDGGLARLRAHGELTATGYDVALRRWLDTLLATHLGQVLTEAGLNATRVAMALRAGDRPLDWAVEVLAAFAPR